MKAIGMVHPSEEPEHEQVEAQAEIARLRGATEFNHGCGECASEAGLTHLEGTGALCSSHAARLREENERRAKWYCPSCSKRHDVPADAFVVPDPSLPALTCSTCGAQWRLEFHEVDQPQQEK